ncbi:cupin domain-containing protein [Shewanella sp. SG44-6]|uniref:cupin domain-containing protein n=1 Tax=Shewanella sp. SG44-6 TaxID=2760959 RepID=UPI0015FF6BCE|nr:cupin domain-containing protein [Shewanella sp. SG44-6]MBB1391069.1 cupin domain-containing protein [Shewanella sp. SG44-6]
MNRKLNVSDCFDMFSDTFTPKVLLDVNDSRIMLVKIIGDKIPWHCHANEDELLWVMKGNIVVHTRTESVHLCSGELYMVAKGIEHKVTTNELAQVLLIESKSFKHTGETESDITQAAFEYLLENNIATSPS